MTSNTNTSNTLSNNSFTTFGDLTTTPGHQEYTYSIPYMHQDAYNSESIMMREIYPFLNNLKGGYGNIANVISIFKNNEHIIGYIPIILFLAKINEHLNRLTWN